MVTLFLSHIIIPAYSILIGYDILQLLKSNI